MTDRLEGWAYPIDITVGGVKIAEHTYVKAPNNGPAYFNCWGGHSGSGQHALGGASGDGYYKVANCYRGPTVLGHEDTGFITYGVTGVCHQTANRFLYSASGWLSPVTVREAKAYIASSLVWGDYGNCPTGPFPGDATTFILTIYPGCWLAEPAQAEKAPPEPPSPPTEAQERAAFYRNVAAQVVAQRAPRPRDVVTGAFAITARHRLGKDSELLATVEGLHTGLLDRLAKVIEGPRKGADFAHEMNTVINEGLSGFEKQLGKEAYSKLFGLAPGEAIALVNPEVTAKTRT